MSRDEMAAALMEVAEGRMPRDRIALKCVWDDMTGWPFLSVDTPAGSASSDATATAASVYEELNDGEWRGWHALAQQSAALHSRELHRSCSQELYAAGMMQPCAQLGRCM